MRFQLMPKHWHEYVRTQLPTTRHIAPMNSESKEPKAYPLKLEQLPQLLNSRQHACKAWTQQHTSMLLR
jgi:hypothetical protein